MKTDTKPTRPGWYWFLPDEHCPTPTGLLRLDKPVVVLVGVERLTRDGPPPPLVVRFPQGTLCCNEMSGDWSRIEAPKAIQDIAVARMVDRDYQRDHEDHWRGD
jgi:hypothetical protein